MEQRMDAQMAMMTEDADAKLVEMRKKCMQEKRGALLAKEAEIEELKSLNKDLETVSTKYCEAIE